MTILCLNTHPYPFHLRQLAYSGISPEESDFVFSVDRTEIEKKMFKAAV
jgi:hypothetical protein